MPNPVAIHISVSGTAAPFTIHCPDRVGAGALHTAAALQWIIDTPDWFFVDANGIEFKADPNNQISASHSAGGPPGRRPRWVAADSNTQAGDLDYTVNLSGPNGVTVSLDPTIVNGAN